MKRALLILIALAIPYPTMYFMPRLRPLFEVLPVDWRTPIFLLAYCIPGMLSLVLLLIANRMGKRAAAEPRASAGARSA